MPFWSDLRARLKALFVPLTYEERRDRELAAARIELLDAETWRDHAACVVEYHKARIRRLENPR